MCVHGFSGGLVFSINAIGRRTGEAVVVMENEQQVALALKRDRHYLGKRYIEVCCFYFVEVYIPVADIYNVT